MYYISETTLIPDSNLGEYNLSESFCNLVLKTLSSSFLRLKVGKLKCWQKSDSAGEQKQDHLNA